MIIGLDVNKTYEAFARLGEYSVDKVKAKVAEQSFFNEYEKGKLDDSEFRSNLRSLLNTNAADSDIDTAWNAMVLHIPQEKYRLLTKLKTRCRLFLLSNTNNIHLQFVNQIVFNDTGHSGIGHFFHKDYYSHIMNMRKPETEIFQRVLLENNLIATETHFLDDTLENIQSASSLGIQTTHVTSPEMVLSLFS